MTPPNPRGAPNAEGAFPPVSPLGRRAFLMRLARALITSATAPLLVGSSRAAAQESFRIGHLTTRGGRYGPLGELGLMGARLAVEDANARGTAGRAVALVQEDVPNPSVAIMKANRLVERERVHALVGGVSNTVGLMTSEAAKRLKVPYLNTGWSTEDGRGRRCHRYLFHVEAGHAAYVNAIGRWLLRRRRLVRWAFLTGAHAPGYELLRLSRRLLLEEGGTDLGSELIPAGLPDYREPIQRLRMHSPDVVFVNLVGDDLITFLRQWRDYGAPFEVAGVTLETAEAWAAGQEILSGVWPCLWYHRIGAAGVREFTARFVRRYGRPPDGHAWADYVAVGMTVRALEVTRSPDSRRLAEYLEGGYQFDAMKTRRLWFREFDHQLAQPLYIVRPKARERMDDRWDVFEVVEEVPGRTDPLESLLPLKEQSSCDLGNF